jgi:hypothetical protein
MTQFNRIVTTLLLLALIPIITIVLIAPREAIELVTDALDQIYSQLDPSPSTLQLLLRLALVLVIDAFLVVLLYLQVRRTAASGVRVHQVEDGDALIAVDSVVSRLGYRIDQLPGVLDVTPTVTPRRRGVEVVLDVEITAGSNIPANIEEISTVTRSVVEQDMGLKLKGKPKINLRTVEYPGIVIDADVQIPAQAALADDMREDEESAPSESAQESKAGEVDEPGEVDTSG